MSDNEDRVEMVVYMDGDEFADEGYLQEVNRQLLHPLGVALEMSGGWTRDGVRELLDDNDIRFGDDAVDTIWTFIVKAGLDKPHPSGIWDYRDDPEGIAFDDSLLATPQAREKAKNIQRLMHDRAPERIKRLGWVIQPIPPGS